MDADQIIQNVEQKYTTCHSYRDRGMVFFDAPNGEKDVLQFRTLFKRPDHLVFQWQDYGPRRGKTEEFSTLWTLAGETWVRKVQGSGVSTERMESLSLAQAGAVGCSAGAAGIVISALMPELRDNFNTLLGLDDFRINGSEIMGNIPCHMIKASGRRNRSNYLWISTKDFSIQKFLCNMSRTAAEQEVEMKELFANKELMAMMKDKGWEPPTSPHYGDRTMEAEYHFSEIAFDEEFEAQPRPA